jgi:hypothetical protein
VIWHTHISPPRSARRIRTVFIGESFSHGQCVAQVIQHISTNIEIYLTHTTRCQLNSYQSRSTAHPRP